MPFFVNVYSDSFLFWQDTIGIYIYPTEVIAGQSAEIPAQYNISQNFPNPFNPTTSIVYQIPERSHVTIKIYNTVGQEVKVLVDEHKPAGFYTVGWNGLSHDGSKVGSGIYVYQIRAGDYAQTKKMAILR